jgi:hypothetical protein
MNTLQMKPEINEMDDGARATVEGSKGHTVETCAALCNPAGGRRLRRRAHATHLAPPRDDGFHPFRIY